MIFLEREEWNIAQNFKVFSSIIAQRISGKNVTTRQQFALPNQTKPNTKIALLVANPITKFYAACREDKIDPDTALGMIKSGNKLSPFHSFPSFHFFPQSRYLLNHKKPVYAWRAPDHIEDFWEEMNLGEPPVIYDRQESLVNESELREIYQQDFQLWEQVTSPKKLIVPSKELEKDLRHFCSDSLQIRATFDSKMLARAGQAAQRFASSGFAITHPEALATREATCRACPEWDATALNATGRCRKCGCSTWAKLRMATERCPIGKWEAEDVSGLKSPVSSFSPPSAPLLT